jgi:hypothetical protein
VAWWEQKRSGGAGKAGGDGGSDLLKGRSGETAEGVQVVRVHGTQGGRGSWPRPTAARPRRARVGDAVRTGARHPLTHGPRLAVGGRGRGEVRGRGGWPGRKWRSGPSPDEQESLRFNQINFKLV